MGGKSSRPRGNSSELAFRTSPVKDVHGEAGSNEHMTYALAAMQGWRSTMEDAHILHLHPRGDCGFFAVLDGHSGRIIADTTRDSLLEVLGQHLVLPDASEAFSQPEHSVLEGTLKKSFLEHDTNMGKMDPLQLSGAGSTCASVLITPTHVTFAHIGDSRAMFVRNGRIVHETRDHKPAHENETRRIYAAGGVVLNDRVGGCLAVSRAFGDFEFKRRRDLGSAHQQVSADPDVTSIPRDANSDEFILLACDGVFDVLTSKAAASFVARELKKRTPREACEALVRRSLQLGSQDNISAIVVRLPKPGVSVPSSPSPASPVSSPASSMPGETRGEVSERIAQRVVTLAITDALLAARKK
jgi:protein phosphatase 1B